MKTPIKLTCKVAATIFFGTASCRLPAGFTINDLYLGFTQSSAASDYIIDLGQPGTVGLGGSSVVD